MFFKKKEEPLNSYNQFEENSQEDSEEIGVVIHFTSHVIYVFICKDNVLDISDKGSIEMTDLKGKCISIMGHFISLELSNIEELPEILEQYAIYQLNLPIIQIYVKQTFY